jgi:pyruvate dehydrogenase E1 component beta subunit
MAYYVPGDVPVRDYSIPLGVAAVRREGSDVTLISYGRQVADATAAANQLDEEGINAEVIDLRTLVPLDLDTVLASVTKTRRAVVAHEAVTRCGFGAELASQIHERLFDRLTGPVLRVGAPNTPVPYALELERAYLPGAVDIAEAARRAVVNT